MGLYLGDMIYYIVLFLILMWLIKLVAWKPLEKVLDKRTRNVQDRIDSANSSDKKAQQLVNQRSAELVKLQNQSGDIIDTAKQNGQKQQDRIISDAHKNAQVLKQNSQAEAKQERQDAVSGAKDDVANLSVEIASKIVEKNLDPKAQKDLIDSCIKGLKKQNG